jgi:hypothetical protein
MKHSSLFAAVASLALLVPATPLLAQDNQQPPGGGRGRFDPEAFRKMMTDRMKSSMKATDEEWAVLEPMISNVVEKQMAARGGFRFGGPPPRSGDNNSSSGGNNNSGGSSRSSRYPQPAEVEALRETLEKENAPKEELKARLEAIRAQKKRAQQELEDARAQLAKVVTVRQEAVLVAFGILE